MDSEHLSAGARDARCGRSTAACAGEPQTFASPWPSSSEGADCANEPGTGRWGQTMANLPVASRPA